METPNSYTAVESIIRMGEIRLSELEHLLDILHRQERITILEQETLLELAWKRSILCPDQSFASLI